ncbi:putative integral membrane protein [Theileria parva strain Muguga]|uniref:putative integral membrane protein n=1 Tax=Theileria parva strain Muguga TaxID=333668 RepID=UPI001C6187F8|nr:putative integral membrane protein [Theileria parva strain Muguga]KAF5153443.1 putative integral membrane protein [Theileria parva strain Muguga]
MWIDKIYEKYRRRTDEIEFPEVEKPKKEFECDFDRLSKILPSNYFDLNSYKEEPYDPVFMKKAGIFCISLAILVLSLTLYMLYHCKKSSCADCLLNLHKLPCDSCKSYAKEFINNVTSVDYTNVVPYKLLVYLRYSDNNTCSPVYCIYNNIWKSETHYEKCYYSNLIFNTIVLFLLLYFAHRLSMVSFKHSMPAVVPNK